jgi:hypothetical protein
MKIMDTESERLRYSGLRPEHLDSFHRLVQDAHVRRYLMDGEVLPRYGTALRDQRLDLSLLKEVEEAIKIPSETIL